MYNINSKMFYKDQYDPADNEYDLMSANTNNQKGLLENFNSKNKNIQKGFKETYRNLKEEIGYWSETMKADLNIILISKFYQFFINMEIWVIIC